MSFFSRDFNSRTRRTNQASIFESLYGSEAGGSETGSQISTQTLPLQYSQLPVTQARKTLSSIGERSGRFDQQYSLNPLSFRRENTEDLEPGSPRVGNVFRSVDLEELDGDDDSQLPPSGDLVLEDIRVDSGEVENVSLRTQKWIEDMSKVDRANTSRKQPDRHRLVRRQQPKLKRQKSGPMPQNPYSFGDILEVTNSDEGHSVGGEEESSNMESKDSTEIAVKITKQLESSEHTGELSDDLPEYLEEDPSRKPEVKIPKVERNVKTGENVKDGFEDLIKWLQVDKTSPESLQVEPLSLSTSDEQTGCSSEKELDTNTDSLPTHSPDGLKKRVKEEAESERRDKTSTSEQMKQKIGISSMSNITLWKSQRNKKVLYMDGHIYNESGMRVNFTRYRCRNQGCSGKLLLSVDQKVLDLSGHDHPKEVGKTLAEVAAKRSRSIALNIPEISGHFVIRKVADLDEDGTEHQTTKSVTDCLPQRGSKDHINYFALTKDIADDP